MSTVAYKCINCGGPLKYDPQKLKFACEYCLSDFTEEELQARWGNLDEQLDDVNQQEQEPEQTIPDDEFSQNAVMYSCPSCGAEILTDKTTAATFCVYCHSPVVLSNRLAGDFKPDKVIPFMISEKDAKQRFLDFCRKKHFLPKDFVSDAQLDMMKGVYYPYWLVDSLKDGGVLATAKKIRTWRKGDYRYTETKIFKVRRAGKIDFKGFPCPALKNEDKKALKYVNPYDEKDYKPFTMSYLSGFQAEKRDTERADVQGEVDVELLEYAKKIYRDTINGYDSVNIDHIDLKTLKESWKYALMPVWLMTYKYKDKTYLYAMNGQTGKTYGELPCSGKKLAIFGGIMFVVIFLIAMLGGYFIL